MAPPCLPLRSPALAAVMLHCAVLVNGMGLRASRAATAQADPVAMEGGSPTSERGVDTFFERHPAVPIVFGVLVAIVLLVGVVYGRRTWHGDIRSEKLIVSNQFSACVLLGCMTVTPGLLLMIIGGSLDGSSPAAGAGMFVGGFFLSLLAVACLGPSSYVMDVENGRVLIIRRYCLMFPRVSRYEVEDIRGFFLRMSVDQARTSYQLHMELMTGLTIPMEATKSDSSLRERQELCFHMNEMLLESRRTHFGYGALGHSKGVVGARVADALPPSGSVVQGLLGDDGSDSGSSYSGSTVSSRTSLSSAHRQILAAITPGDAPRRSSTHRSINA